MKAKSNSSLFNISEIAVSYNPKFKALERPQISTSVDAFDIFISNWDHGTLEFQEHFYILLLNRANRVLGISKIATGSMTAVIVDPKIIFGIALKAGATGLILAHNHPSGNMRPSSEDVKLTNKFIEIATMLEMKIFDHLVVTKHSFYSFSDEGLL